MHVYTSLLTISYVLNSGHMLFIPLFYGLSIWGMIYNLQSTFSNLDNLIIRTPYGVPTFEHQISLSYEDDSMGKILISIVSSNIRLHGLL